MNRYRVGALIAASLCFAQAEPADAFCGFYVGGAGSQLYNNATQVVLLRDGTRTVVSMQNNYQGPPESFALVVPVPVVLHKPDVKTLPRKLFDRIDTLAAPRLVEYWEQDPCAQPVYPMGVGSGRGTGVGFGSSGRRSKGSRHGVKVEAKFAVGEYQIVILSATESTGLETWLHEEGFKIPAGAAQHLKPYVEQGSKFFVAKVDVSKVTMKDGMAQLSPLRFHYDSDDLRLPIRLGLMNAKDKQDLIVHVLGKGTRYELANYANAFIPTNFDLKEGTKERFGEFYAALFDATLEKNPGAAITEYAWSSSSCDPCPTPALRARELAALGMDVLAPTDAAGAKKIAPTANRGRSRRRMGARGWVLTRIHMRYGPKDVKDDLVFRTVGPVMGGREMRSGPGGKLEKGARAGRRNNFQARYAIRHPWTSPMECAKPIRGRWGGPPAAHKSGQRKAAIAARDLAFAPRGRAPLGSFVSSSLPELSVVAAAGGPPAASAAPKTAVEAAQPDEDKPATGAAEPAAAGEKTAKKESKGCLVSARADTDRGAPWGVLVLVAFAAHLAARRRRN